MDKKTENKCEETHQKFDLLLNGDQPIDLEALKELTWHGVPYRYRSAVWKILLGYLPPDKASRDYVLAAKREEYIRLVETYFTDVNARSPKTDEESHFKCFSKDAPRIRHNYGLFTNQTILDIMTRSAYIWYITQFAHLDQGMPFSALLSLMAPLIAAFIGEYVRNINCETFDVPGNFERQFGQKERLKLEADVFWCIHGVMEKVLKNFSFLHQDMSVPFEKMTEILQKADPELMSHLENQELKPNIFASRWMLCFLGMDLSPRGQMRLFDTYIADEQGFGVLHCYVCCEIVLKYSDEIEQKVLEEALFFIREINLPSWKEEDIEEIVEKADRKRKLYNDAKGYLSRGVKGEVQANEKRKGCSCF